MCINRMSLHKQFYTKCAKLFEEKYKKLRLQWDSNLQSLGFEATEHLGCAKEAAENVFIKAVIYLQYRYMKRSVPTLFGGLRCSTISISLYIDYFIV